MADQGAVVKELHRDLARKWLLHETDIVRFWKGFTKAQRVKAIRDGAMEGQDLKHSTDTSMGNVYEFMPEWDLKDLTEADADTMLELLRYRATTSLFEQYSGSRLPNEVLGDHALILHMQDTKNLRHADEAKFRNSYTFFMDDSKWGQSYDIKAQHSSVLAGFEPAIRANVCVPRALGELIINRQMYLLQALNVVIEDILEIGKGDERSGKKPVKKNAKIATAALAKLAIRDQVQPIKLTLADVRDTAKEQSASIRDYLNLLFSEPTLLSHAINLAFFSRPELVPDEKGRVLPVHTDRYISAAFFEAVHQSYRAAAAWAYICSLLKLLQDATDKSHKAIILQEISNMCQLVYENTQALLKRHISIGIGAKYFRRASNSYTNGNARVGMKVVPEDLTRADPQLHYLLRLCQAETDPAKAVAWMEKLGQLYNTHPSERDRISEREFDNLCEHAVTIMFIQDLSAAIVMPKVSRKNGQAYTSRTQDLEKELNQVRDSIDLSDFVVPIDNIKATDVAQGALQALDDAVITSTGAELGFLYEDVIEDCLQDLKNQFQQAKAKAKADAKQLERARATAAATQATEQDHKARIEQRRSKEKTRPARSAPFEPETSHQGAIAAREENSTDPRPSPLKVKNSTKTVFQNLFKKSEARGTISWDGFTAAMADVGFSVIPKFGSVFTFSPKEDVGLKQSLTLHRPHGSTVEPWLQTVLAQRLKRIYGWTADDFVTAS
jgi:hypothetical protein